jgi:hypothetical protein
MTVFISYSSQDRAFVEALLKALRRAREQVWLDEELSGGEAWWREILEQIRGCSVFIVALSKNSLASKACQAELQYAQALGKPILPVRIGALDNVRINPTATMQVLDYRNPTVESGIELVSSLHALRAKQQPLPDPLPEEPPVPFAYLMRLASTISNPATLSPQEQMMLVAEIKAGLEEDGGDASARRDLAQLLRMLRDRSDVTWRTRTEVESVLESLEPKQADEKTRESPYPPPPPPPAYATGPRPTGGTGPQPMYQGPPTGPPSGPPPGFYQPMSGPQPAFGNAGPPGGRPGAAKSRKPWLIAGGVAAVLVIVAVVAVIALSGNGDTPTAAGPTSSTTPTRTIEPQALTSLLLTATEVRSIMDATNLESGEVYEVLTTSVPTVSDAACAGAQYNALESVYKGSGYSAVVDQVFSAQEPEFIYVNQTAVLFPSPSQAQALLDSSENGWRGCVGKTVTITNEDASQYNWSYGEVTRDDDRIEQRATQEGMGNYGCQHVIQVLDNVILETQACSDRATDEAVQMAEMMADKAP